MRYLAGPLPTLLVAVLFAGAVGWALQRAWDPPASTYLDYVPIAAVFAAFFWDRLFPTLPTNRRSLIYDALIVVLALMRVFVPPLPFVSGHALFASYAVLTARRWPLRTLAALVLLHVCYVKLYGSGGVRSLVAGVVLSCIVVWARQPKSYPI